MADVTFLGLGVMGTGMVLNLLKAGHRVTVWNRTAGRDAEVAAAGATVASTPREAVQDADVVMYCLADDSAVTTLVHADDGLAANVPDEAIVIDLSTVAPETSLAEHRAYADRGVRFLDAPVFGTRGEAREGGLWIVVGGDAEVLAEARGVLEPLSATIHHLGGPASGARMKLVGNLLVASQLEALGEALSLARKAELDLPAVLEVLAVTDFRTPIYDGVGAAVLADDYSPDFALHLMQKDMRLIRAFADGLGVPVPSTTATAETIDRAVDAGHADENASALIKVLAADAGVSLRRT